MVAAHNRESKRRVACDAADVRGPGVYVLEFCDGCFYVGKSIDRERRIQQHLFDPERSSAWCRTHRNVVRVHAPTVPHMCDLDAWEQKETVARMLKHGFERVRGWEFTSTAPLTPVECAMVRTLVFGSGDLCRTCGRAGHYGKGCTSTARAGWLEDIEHLAARGSGGTARGAGAYPRVRAPPRSAPAPRRVPPRVSTGRFASAPWVPCWRCGRKGHYASECFARSDVRGDGIAGAATRGTKRPRGAPV